MICNDYTEMLRQKPMTLIMSLPANDPEMCRAAFAAGADVVKCHINLSHHASGTLFDTFEKSKPILEEMLSARKGPMGIVPGNSVEKVEADLEQLLEMPFSFYSLYTQHTPPGLIAKGVPLMAACDSTYTLEEVKQIEKMGASILEASIVPGEEYGTRLSLRDLLRYEGIASSTALPVVVPTQRNILPEDIPALHATGIRGLMIGAIVTGRETESVARAVSAFRNAIDKL